MKRGIYSIITTFFFILIIIIVSIGVIYYGITISKLNSTAESGMNKYVILRNVRDSIYFCYGRTIDDALLDNKICINNIKLSFAKDIISGYKIIRLNVNNCTYREWASDNISESYDNVFMYSLPIGEGYSDVCLGRLEVYI